MNSVESWRLCEELDIIQAALLVVGADPTGLEMRIEAMSPERRPTGYDAAKQAIARALRQGDIDGVWVRRCEYDLNGDYIGVDEDTVDLAESQVHVPALRRWLAARGVADGFFFPDGADYLNPGHPRYAPGLAAAVAAWLSADPDTFLRENAARFGLTAEQTAAIGKLTKA